MAVERLFSWGLLWLWSTWLFAIQGYLAARSGPGFWVPDLGIVLLLMLERRAVPGSMPLAVLVVSCARIGVSSEPGLAILVGYGLLVGCMRLLRQLVEVDQSFLRAILAAMGFLMLNKYWALSRAIALSSGGQEQLATSPWTSELPLGSWSMAASTALGILVLGPLLIRLPGLSPLRRRRR